MTETDWLAYDDPERLLQFLRNRASERKLRLLAYACCRRVEHLLDVRSRSLLDLLERQVEGTATEVGVAFAQDLHDGSVAEAKPYTASHIAGNMVNAAKVGAAWPAAWNVVGEARRALRFSHQGNTYEEARAQADLVREICGNPFRPVVLHPTAITPEIAAVAQSIYERRSFDRLPELAGLLEAAGCREVDLLGHLRGPGPHVPGCFALDLILRK